MNIEITEVNETRKSAVITVSAEEVLEVEKALLSSYQQRAKIKGFRPGKAPVNMIQAQYGKEIADDLKSRVTSKAYDYMLAEVKDDVYQVVDADTGGEVRSQNKAAVSFTFDIVPAFELPEYKGVTVELNAIEVTTEERDKAVQNIVDQRSEFKVVEEAAKAGDYVKVAYEGKIDGKSLDEVVEGHPMYTKQAGTWEEAGAKDAPGVQAVVDGVVGMKAGDSKEETMTFPEDFHIEALRGKEVTYSMEVQEVRQKVAPEMDEEFFKAMEVKDLDELHSKIEEEFKKRKENESGMEARDKLAEQISEAVALTVPESAVEGEADSILQGYMTRMVNQGVPYEAFEEKREELLADARKAGEKRAKSMLILEAIAKKESIELKNEDLNMIVYQEAMASGMKPDDFVKELKADRSKVMELRRRGLANKVLDFLYKEAKIEYKSGAS